MKIIKRGSKIEVPFSAKNSYGGDLTLTSASIYATIKEDRDSSTVKVLKRNTTAGGGDTEILVTSSPYGLVFLTRADTLGLEERTYYMDIVVEIGDNSYVVYNDIIKIEKTVRTTGDSAEDISVIATKYYEAAIDSDAAETVSVERGFTGALTPSRSSTGLFLITSISGEFVSNKTEITASTYSEGITVTYEHYSTSVIRVRVYNSNGDLFDAGFVITIKVF
ncbi:MAG: hypothetical protein NUV80_00210 [Candidatus Berkelbacteria bacterium]|nr:hypothetical protein [Candidatus Berkelbacteria bacterium]